MHTAPKRLHQECPPQVTGEAEPLGPIRHLVQKATLSTQGSSQNVETKKQVTNDRNGGKQTTGYRVQNHSYKFFKNFLETADKFSEILEHMKKNQLEIKYTLTEIKNNIQRSAETGLAQWIERRLGD